MYMYHDEQNFPGEWSYENLALFNKVILRYIQLLQPLRADGNTAVFQELEEWMKIRRLVNAAMHEAKTEGTGGVSVLAKHYGKLFDMIWKYYGWKKQELDERKRKIAIEAAHEGALKELEFINQVLSHSVWEQFTRHHTLIDTFYTPQEEPKPQSAGLQITIHNLYGQFAAINNGSMVQNNNSEALGALKEITDALIKSDLPDNDKEEALADVETVQAQLKKKTPNKAILDAGMVALQVAANAAQIYQAVEPHFHTITHFISQLPHP